MVRLPFKHIGAVPLILFLIVGICTSWPDSCCSCWWLSVPSAGSDSGRGLCRIATFWRACLRLVVFALDRA